MARRFCSSACWYDKPRAAGHPDLFAAWTPAEAWLAGLIWADGNLTFEQREGNTRPPQPRVTIVTTDWEIAHQAAEIVGVEPKERRRSAKGGGAIRGREIRGAKQIWTVRFGRREPIQRLIDVGLHPNKSLTLTFPVLPEQALRHFIRGHFDGDGSISLEGNRREHGRYRVQTTLLGTETMLADMAAHLVDAAGIRPRRIYPTGSIFCVKMAHNDSMRFGRYIYDAGGPYLTRKRDKFGDLDNVAAPAGTYSRSSFHDRDVSP